ncbi:hypothetical protein [Nonomuraea roseoviolacea]|uniref:hypothetical protein n=1 Tax=Nonomuraea roseoviolacea TaxID=103837 RepID=UPI0031D5D761
MPGAPVGLGAFAEGDERGGDVGKIGDGVRLVEVTDPAGGLAGQGGGEDGRTDDGVDAARPVIVGGPPQGGAHASDRRRRVREGAFAPADPADLAVRLDALAHGLCSLHLRGALGDADEARRHWDDAFETMV